MASRRMISKSISVSAKVNSISDFSALLFTWMIPHLDDYGVLDGDEGTIKALVVPRRKQTASAVGQALEEMQKIGLIWRYLHNERPYVQFINFEEHQEGLHKRTAPKLPLYMDCCHDSGKFREIPGNSLRTEQNRTEQKRNELTYDYFSDFWKEYPKKEKKIPAQTIFNKMKMTDDLMEKIMSSLYKFIASEEWKKDNGKFIPHPTTWLNQRRWEDGQ